MIPAEHIVYTEEFLLAPEKLHDASYFSKLWPHAEAVTVEIPRFEAVLTYNAGSCSAALPQGGSHKHIIEYMLLSLEEIAEYNKLLVCLNDGKAYVVLATGEKLLLAECYKAETEMTLLYWLLLVARQTQINPQQTTVHCIGEGDIVDFSNIRECFKEVKELISGPVFQI